VYAGFERCTQGFLAKAERKRPLGRSMLRWENKIKMDLQDIA
jgi:hypothetical protein